MIKYCKILNLSRECRSVSDITLLRLPKKKCHRIANVAQNMKKGGFHYSGENSTFDQRTSEYPLL